ncbi:MAG: FecR domain-containing protein [Gemmatimonadaceae bacterium]
MTDTPSSFDDTDTPESPDWEAVGRHLAGEDTPGSIARVNELAADPSVRDLLAALDDATTHFSEGLAKGIDVDAALGAVKGRMNSAGARPLKLEPTAGTQKVAALAPRWRVPFPAIAAVGLLAIGLGTWASIGRQSEPAVVAAVESPRMVATGVGSRDSMRLSDGTKVVLGPLSSVKVASGYDTTSRNVDIRGDAYFEVVHDSSKPFTVHVENATIQDIGTKFAIHSDGVGGIGVSVMEGSVSLAPVQSAAPPVVLNAGDQGKLDKGGKVAARRGATTEDDMAWLSGRLVFRETPLSEVVSSMRRWYGIELQLMDSSLANRHLTATFSGEPPDRVIEVLRLALGADVERHGDTVFVRSVKGRAR